MEKKPLTNAQLLAHLETLPQDHLQSFLLASNQVRGFLVQTTSLVNEVCQAHGTGILESKFLAQGLSAAALLSGTLKNKDRLQLKVECGGPLGGLAAETNASGDLRGRVFVPNMALEKAPDSLDLEPFMGPGFLSLTRILEGGKDPFTGTVALEKGRLAQDLTHYFLTSEQTPTAFVLSVYFAQDGSILGSGGLFLQALPEAEEGLLDQLAEQIEGFDGLAQALSKGTKSPQIIEDYFGSYGPRLLEKKPLRFYCPCSKDRISSILGSMDLGELRSMAQEGPFPLQTQCHQCLSVYEFSQTELQDLLNRRN